MPKEPSKNVLDLSACRDPEPPEFASREYVLSLITDLVGLLLPRDLHTQLLDYLLAVQVLSCSDGRYLVVGDPDAFRQFRSSARERLRDAAATFARSDPSPAILEHVIPVGFLDRNYTLSPLLAADRARMAADLERDRAEHVASLSALDPAIAEKLVASVIDRQRRLATAPSDGDGSVVSMSSESVAEQAERKRKSSEEEWRWMAQAIDNQRAAMIPPTVVVKADNYGPTSVNPLDLIQHKVAARILGKKPPELSDWTRKIKDTGWVHPAWTESAARFHHLLEQFPGGTFLRGRIIELQVWLQTNQPRRGKTARGRKKPGQK